VPLTTIPTASKPRLGTLLLAATLCVSPAVASASAFETVPLSFVERYAESDGPTLLTPTGLVLPVSRSQTLVLPLPGLDRLELDLVSEGHFRLVWTNENAADVGGSTPPPPFLVIRPGPSTISLDTLIAPSRDPGSRPVLEFLGSGTLTITGARASRATGGREELARRAALATLLAPQTIWPATINFLQRPLVSASPACWFDDAVALLSALAAAVAVAAAWRRMGRRGALAAGLVAACLTATLLSDALLLVRFLPAFRLAPTPSPEERIAENYYFHPELGVVAALARSTLPVTDRVGVIGPPGDWFSSQTLCFNLAPRPCVRIDGKGPTYGGISEVERLAIDQLDSIVVVSSDAAPPPGFQSVAAVNRFSFVARRP
jgi:hypothetical protein